MTTSKQVKSECYLLGKCLSWRLLPSLFERITRKYIYSVLGGLLPVFY